MKWLQFMISLFNMVENIVRERDTEREKGWGRERYCEKERGR